MITYLIEINIIANFNFLQGNILQLIEGEAYDILPSPPFLTLLVFNIPNGDAMY